MPRKEAHHEQNDIKAADTSTIFSDNLFSELGKTGKDSVSPEERHMNTGGTQELPYVTKTIRESETMSSRRHSATQAPELRPATGTHELDVTKEDTEELPRVELDETVMKPAEQDAEELLIPGEKSEFTDPSQEDKDDKTRLQPND